MITLRIDRIEISRFGGLCGVTLTPGAGVNIVEGKNERGKSTVAAFIKYIFYGFSDKRERLAALPVSGGSAGGNAAITVNGRSLRIERETAADGTERLTVTKGDSKSPLRLSKSPGETLFGIDAEVFMRTAFITQTGGGAIADGDGAAAVDMAIENLLYSADESISTEKALDALDSARVKLRHKNGKGGSIGALMGEREKLSERLSRAEQTSEDIIAREAMARELTKKIEDNREMSKKLSDELHAIELAALSDKISRLRAAEREYGAAVREYRACAAKYTAVSYPSPAKYLARLREESASLEAIGRQLSQARGALSSEPAAEENTEAAAEVPPTSDAELLELESKLEKDGGRDAVLSAAHKCGGALRLMTALCGIFTFIAVFCAAAAVLSYFNMPDYTIWAICGAGAGAVALVITALVRSHRADERDAILERYCCEDSEELEETLGYIIASANRLRERLQRQKELDTQRGARESERDEIVGRISASYDAKAAELKALLAESGRSGDPAAAIAELGDYCAELRALYDEALRRRDEASKQRSALADVDVEAIEEEAKKLDRAAIEGADRRELKRRFDFSTAAVTSMTERLHETEVELASRRASSESAAELAENLAELDSELFEQISRADALTLAHDKLSEASETLRSDVTPRLSSSAGALMSTATGGKYDEIGVSPKLGLYFRHDGRTLADSYMSGGTRDAAYIALRFALLGLLCRQTPPPVMLDEAFSRLDDERMENMLRILSAKAGEGVQTFVFTSSGRESQLMNSVGPFELISM